MIAGSKKQSTIIVAAIVLVAVFFGGLYLPLTGHLATIKAAQRQFTAEAARTSNDATRLPALSDQLKKMRVMLGDFSSQVPPSRQLGEFLQTVAKVMNELSLQEQLLQPGQVIKAGELSSVPIDLQCEGSLQQIFGLLTAIEKTDRVIRFENLEMTTDKTFNGKVMLHSRLFIYYKDNSGGEI
jgi:Tfp pilus assembly protein PilO